VHEEDHGGRRARRPERFARFGQRAQGAAGPAVVGRDDEPEPADLAEGAQVVAGLGTLAVDARGLGCDVLLGGPANRVEDASNVGHEDPFDW
jgi:hypothetical protein